MARVHAFTALGAVFSLLCAPILAQSPAERADDGAAVAAPAPLPILRPETPAEVEPAWRVEGGQPLTAIDPDVWAAGAPLSPAGQVTLADLSLPADALTARAAAEALYGGLPAGARLYRRQGDILTPADQWIAPDRLDAPVQLAFDAGGIEGARGVLWQIAYRPFPPADRPQGDFFNPEGLIRSAIVSQSAGTLSLPIGAAARELGYRPPVPEIVRAEPGLAWPVGESPPAGGRAAVERAPQGEAVLSSTGAAFLEDPQAAFEARRATMTGALTALPEGARARLATVLAEAGGALPLYVRIIPLALDGSPRPGGRPSEQAVIRIGTPPPSDVEIQGRYEIIEAPALRLVRIEYAPPQVIAPWPPGCDPNPPREGRRPGPFANMILETWDWVSEGYETVKGYAVDAVAIALPFIPEEALAIALDAALVAAGAPPNIPNLNQLMDQGASYLAKEAAAQLLGPAGAAIDQAILAELGGYAGAAVGASAQEARDLARRALEARLEADIRAAAQAAEAAILENAADIFCHSRYYPATVTATVENPSSDRAEAVPVTIRDSARMFWPVELAITLAPREAVTFSAPLEENNFRDFEGEWRSGGNARTNADILEARRAWWRALGETRSTLSLRGPQTMRCFLLPGAPTICEETSDGTGAALRFSSPAQPMGTGYVYPAAD